MNDIDFSGMIFNGFEMFKGTLDGNGYAIKNLNLGGASSSYMAFFKNMEGATVKNLAIKDVVHSNYGSTFTAVLGGYVNNSTFENIVIDGVTTTSGMRTIAYGVLAGSLENSTVKDMLINDVCNDIIYSPNRACIGGIAGTAYNCDNIENVTVINATLYTNNYSYGPINCAGGLFGIVTSVNVYGAYVDANLGGVNTSTGQIAGCISDSSVEMSIIDGIASSSASSTTIPDDSVINKGSTNEPDILQYWCDHNSLKNYGNGLFMSNSLASTFDELGGPGISTSLVQRTATANGQFNEGTFTITAGLAGSEVTKTIEVEGGDTIDDIITKINNSGLGVTASITADGKFVINSDSTDANFRIKVESGLSDFLEYVGMVSETTSTGILSPGSDVNQFTTLKGNNYVTASDSISAGSFKINDITIDFAAGTIQSAIDTINSYTSQTGVVAELIADSTGQYNVVLRASMTGPNQTIFVDGGTSNFGSVSGLTTQSISTTATIGTDGSNHTITGSKTVYVSLTEEEALAQGYELISSSADLIKIRNATDGTKFILTNNINLSGYAHSFSITASNITIDGNGYGFFNYSSDSSLITDITGNGVTIKNLGISNFNIEHGEDVGLLIGHISSNDVTFSNIYIGNSTLTASGIAAGLVSVVEGDNITIKNVYVDKNVTINSDSSYAGGLVGYNNYTLDIDNVNVLAVVEGYDYAGGLIGYAFYESHVNISNSAYTGNQVVATYSYGMAGGLVGYNDDFLWVKNSFVLGSVISPNQKGVFVGNNALSDLKNSFYNQDYFTFKSYAGSVSQAVANNPNVNGIALSDAVFDKYFDNYISVNAMSFNDSTKISTGTVIVNGTTINLTSSSSTIISVDDAVSQINAKSSQTGVTAEIKNGKVVFTSDSAFTIAAGTSDFVQKTGTAGYTVNAATETTIGNVVSTEVKLDKITESEAISRGYTVIKTADEFFTKLSANPSGKYILMNDIDFSGASYAQISNFDGILEGNGYTIKNYTSSNALIYSSAEGAEIKNLHIDNAQITPTTSSYAAVLVRQANGSISFSNIDITNSDIDGSDLSLNFAGFLVGRLGSGGTNGYNVSIENVNIDSNSSIYGSETIGALIGMNLHSGFTTVRNVTSAASITASSYAGGLIGFSYYTDYFFENVKSTGTITSRNTSNTKSFGGFIGGVYSTPAAKSNITFKDSYASVSIKKSDGTNYDTARQNQFVGSVSGNVSYTSITYDNAKYNSSVADSTGEGGTAGSSSGISGYDANWSPLQVQLSESEALAQGYTVIHNASEFVSKINANKSGKFILIGDIDMSSLTSYTSISGFNGTLNGNGYKISSLGDYYATTPVATNGLFSSVTDGAKFKNIIIEDFTISGADDVGLLAGNVSGTVEFDNITIQGTNRISGGFNVGGVIGQASSASIFANNIYISDSTSISANSDAGGFIGFVANGSLIKLSNLETYAESVSVADAGAGGVIGESFDSSLIFSNVYANMYSTAVYTGNDYSGGIIGQVEFLSDSINIVFSNVYSETGLVDGGPSRGAVFGSLYGEDNPYFLNNTAYISSAYGGDDYAQSLSSSEFNAQLDRTEFYTDSYKYFQGNLTIKLGNNNPVNVVIDTSSLDELLEKLNTYGIDTTFDNGILTISSSSGFSISGTGNVLEILNLSAGNYYNKIQYGSVKGLTKDTKFDGLTSGYLKYGEGAATNSVYISSSDSLGSIIDKINNATSSSFEAGIDSLGRFYIKKLNNSSTSIVVSFTTTNLNNFIGIADNSSSQSNTAIESSSSTLSGSVNVTGNETLNAGSFTLMLGNVSRDFTVNQGETINKVLEKINNAGLALTASIKDGKVFILANDGNNDDINVIEYSGNFAELAGLKTALISEKTLSNNDLNTNCVAGDFNIEYNGNTYKINVENEKISSVLSKINALNIGLTASIVDNKVLIVANDPKGGNITFIDGTSDFTKKVGLSSGGEQSAVIDAGTNSTLTSANMVTSISGMYSSGDFSIHITDNNGNIISSEKITISSTDSINNIIDKINSSNAGVTAYVDGNTGKMVLQRNSSDTAGGILVTKGTSNFTNRIGFTSGGEQSVTTATGSQAELISTSASTGVQFTDGDFIIQMTDKSGNIVSKHEILVSSTDNVSDIVRKINDANIGLYAYIDSATDKMVIERNANTGEGGFVLQKGISDFTNKMGFTSGGNLVAQYEDGDIAIIKSDYDVNEAGTFTEGTFYIDGIEINITADDIASGNAVQAVLDRINDLTDVFASLDNQNRIVLTKKPSAGEGSIEIVKGTSDFTNKFGFTSGGYQTGVSHTGDNATLVSKDVSLNTVVSEGYFYIQRTGNNSTNPIRIDVAANSTIADVIDKINAVTSQTGVIASWDSSSNKIVLTRSGETGEGGFDVIKGTSNFTNIAGFTSGGELYVPICGGNMASVTGANKVAQNTVVSNGDFVIKLDNTEHVITLDTDTTIEAVMEKINAIDGLTAVYDDNTKKITITRDGASGAGSIEIIKGTSDFTNIAGFTSGGSQTATVVQGSKASITSVNKVDDTTKFTAGDFVINVKGETNKSININIDDDDTILSIVDKINADKDSGIFASFDAATGKITISLGAELGDSSIEIVKGSSNFTNVVGFTTGGSSNGVFQDGDTAEIISGNSAASNQHFTEGDFTIKLTGNVPAGHDSEFKINVTANDTLQTIVDKINALDKGVYAFINDDNKLVIRRDADYGSGGIEIIKGTSSFTTDMGITSGGEEFDSLLNAGSSSKIISTQDVATAEGAYTDGNFFIQLLDKNGNAQGGLIQVDINKTGNSVDSISTIINTINSMNAGVTASIENGKFVLTRNQDTEAGSLTVIKGTSDFTNVLGLTSGGNLQDGVYESGEAATNTVLTSKDLGKKLVSDSMTLGSIGVKNGTFKINGVDINVKASDTIYDLASRINSVFSNSAYEDIAVSASYENGELVLRSKNASSTARIVVEKGTTNFTDIAQLTRDYQNSVDLGIEKTGQNAHFNINGKDYDMALDLNDKGQNMIYLDDNGNVLDSSEGASIAINVKQTGNTTIDIGRNLLNDSVEKLQSFVNRFNTAMDAAANPIMSDDTAFNSFINQIKNALTNNIGSINKVTTKLAEIGIIVKITGGDNSNMGSVQISLSKTNGQYDYVEAFYKDPQKVLDLIIGDDSAPLDHNIAGSFVRLSDVLHNALENNRNGYFKITPRSIEAQQKALKREITSTTFDLNELKNTAAGTNEMQGLSEYLLQLEQQYQLINEAIIALNSQYSSSITRLVLNKNNASFKPLVS